MVLLVFPVLPAFSFYSLLRVFFNAPLGSTAVALTASSCTPVRLQSLRAFVARSSPPCTMYANAAPVPFRALCYFYSDVER